MCGICGFVGDDRPELIGQMLSAIAHRGPDDVGEWHDRAAHVGLGHRRLSILDLSQAGHQPMTNEDGTILLSFNGEIYNFAELREWLVARGHSFRSHTDTEVLVHLYEERGERMLDSLNGMFAFAIWDARQRKLFLARDHAGIKPLYYWQSGQRIYFASEIKALLQIPGIPRELNRRRLSEYLTFLWLAGDETMLSGIHKLEPGHCLTFQDGKSNLRRWFTLNYEPDDRPSESEWVNRVEETFLRVTKRQMISDVPLGAFLSGGVDSSSIVACMRQLYPDRPIDCFTARFEQTSLDRDRFEDDFPHSQRVAAALGVNLHEFVLKPDLISLLPKMIWHMDEPDADPAIFPSYLIAQKARSQGTTVLLSGAGGDEVFFGYRSHQALYRYGQIPPEFRGAVAGLCDLVAGAGKFVGAQHPFVRRAAKFRRGLMEEGVVRHMALTSWSSPSTRAGLLLSDPVEEVPQTIQRYFDSFAGRGEINCHTHILVQTFLAAHNLLYTDKTSMAASVEVRVPFLDVELMRLCATIPESMQIQRNVTKNILKKAMRNHLPHEILHRSKTGFMVPLRQWVAHDLNELIRDALSERRVRERGLFNPAAVQTILDDNRANRADHAYLIYALLTLECWMQIFLDGRNPA